MANGFGLGAAEEAITTGLEFARQPAALSGILGAGPQAQAFEQFQASPGQAFLQEEAERALLRNQAAVGGLGGGNVLRELQRQAVGLARQDLQNQFNRQIQAQQPFLQAGRDIGQLRFETGRDIAQQTAGTTSALANLLQQQGAGVANIIGQGAGNIANVGLGLGTNLANLQSQLGASKAAGIVGQAAGLRSGLGQAANIAGNVLGFGGF